MHSSYNHQHLWMQEYYARKTSKINFLFRKEVVQYLFARWKMRLKGYTPYQQSGYRLYLYEDREPTISVVAETSQGFPYRYMKDSLLLVKNPDDILVLYNDSSFKHYLTPKEVLSVLDECKGSLRQTALSLHVELAELRRQIENMELSQKVNQLRKKYKRIPALFTNRDLYSSTKKIYEECLPKQYN